MYFGCATAGNKAAWCLFTCFTAMWVFLVGFVFIYGWENLFFVFIVSGILFCFSFGPVCFCCWIETSPEEKEAAAKQAASIPTAQQIAFGSKSNQVAALPAP